MKLFMREKKTASTSQAGSKDVATKFQELITQQQYPLWRQLTEPAQKSYEKRKRDLLSETDEAASSLAEQLLQYRDYATRNALQDVDEAERLSAQLVSMVEALKLQLLAREKCLFNALENLLVEHFLQLRQVCRGYAEQQAVLNVGRNTELELLHFNTTIKECIRQEKDYLAVLQRRRAEELVIWLDAMQEQLYGVILAAGSLEDSASALDYGEHHLESCSLPDLLPGACEEDASVVDGSVTDILGSSIVDSSGVGSRVSASAPGRDAAVARLRQQAAAAAAAAASEGRHSGDSEGDGGADDVDDGTISDILSSHMSTLTLSSNATSRASGRSTGAMSMDRPIHRYSSGGSSHSMHAC